MNVNEITYTTETNEAGQEFVSEIDSVVSQTMDDGTEVVAEITTTASADDPTQIDSQMTVTETAPDGTETVYEVISNEDGTFKVEDESLAEEIYEAVFDVEIPDELTPVSTDGANENTDNGGFDLAPNNSGNDMGQQDVNSGGEMFGNNFESYQAEPAGMSTPFDNGYEVSSTPYSADFGTDDGTTASDYLYTDTSFDVQPVETSVTAQIRLTMLNIMRITPIITRTKPIFLMIPRLIMLNTAIMTRLKFIRIHTNHINPPPMIGPEWNNKNSARGKVMGEKV